MATKDYFVEYNFATNEGHFETPEEYEKRIMVKIPPSHKFLKDIGITQKVYDNIVSIYNTSKDAINKYKKDNGDLWYKKKSPKNDTFTDGHDMILDDSFTDAKKDTSRMHKFQQKNAFTVLSTLFFSLIDDSKFMEIYLEKENRKNKSMFGQGMDRPVGFLLKIVNELDNVTDNPVNTFVLSYILFKEYDLLMMMDISIKNIHKEDGAKITGIYSALVYLYSYDKNDLEFVKYMEDKYKYFTDTKTKKADIYSLWSNSFVTPGPYNWCFAFLRYVDTPVLEKIMFNIFKEGLAFLLVYGAVLMVENKDGLITNATKILEDLDYDVQMIKTVIMQAGHKINTRNEKITTQSSPRPAEYQATDPQIEKAIIFCDKIKEVHGTLSKFFIKILKKIKVRSSIHGNERVKVIDIKRLKKINFTMKGGRRKSRKKSRRFYGDWEIVNVHTRRTRKRR